MSKRPEAAKSPKPATPSRRSRVKDAGAELVARGSKLTRAERPAEGVANSTVGVVSRNVSSWVAMYAKRSRYNPIRQLTPEYLARIMDIFQNGYLREFALMAEAIKRRDWTVQVCTRKREKGVARHGIKILVQDDLEDETLKEEANRHKAALMYFYDNLHAHHVLEQDQQGGVRLLIEQMMEAVYYRYAVHEMIWRPSFDAVTGESRLTADFNYVPLQFFEASVGHLRFNRRYFGTILGEEMDPKQWLVTVADGLAEPIAVAYMMKSMGIKDWLSFSERFGTPGLLGKTKAALNSPGWNQMVEDLENFAQHWTAVTNTENSIDLIQAAGATGSNIVFENLAQYMDKAIAILIRGADLSTISSGKQTQGRGASLQGDETALIEEDDAALISETLHRIDELVIGWLFNDPVPLAHARVIVPDAKQTTDVIAKLNFMLGAGVSVGVDYARAELGIPKPGEKEELLKAPAPAVPFGGIPGEPGGQELHGAAAATADAAAKAEKDGEPAPGTPKAIKSPDDQEPEEKALSNFEPSQERDENGMWTDTAAIANVVARGVTPEIARHDARLAGKLAIFRALALERLSTAQRSVLMPLLTQISEAASIDDETSRKAALTKIQADLPRWYRRLASDPALSSALEDLYGSAIVSSAAEANAARSGGQNLPVAEAR
jgi:phage gp29-like protein